MPDRLDFEAARRALDEIPATDTWDEAVQRATTDALVQLDASRSDEADRRWLGHTRPPNGWLLAIAACVLAAVAVASLAIPEPEALDTTDPANAPGTTECPSPTHRRTNVSGGQMNKRFAAPVASAATALLLLGACGDDDDTTAADGTTTTDGPVTLAKGEDINFKSGNGFGGQTFHVDVVQDGDAVSGEFRITSTVVPVDCANTDMDGVLLIGGRVTDDPSGDFPEGIWLAVGIREGDPDEVTLFGDDPSMHSCAEYLDSIVEARPAGDYGYEQVVDGDDIETG